MKATIILLLPLLLVVSLWIATYYQRVNFIIYTQPSLLIECHANHGSLRISFINVPHKGGIFAFEYDIYDYKAYRPSVITAITGWPPIVCSTSMEWGFRLPIWIYALFVLILPGCHLYRYCHQKANNGRQATASPPPAT